MQLNYTDYRIFCKIDVVHIVIVSMILFHCIYQILFVNDHKSSVLVKSDSASHHSTVALVY
jgi:hypothetical protein